MAYRKIIKFGDSSFVISLPKEWINKYGLKKGDDLNIKQNNHELIISLPNVIIKKEPKEMTINFTGNFKDLKGQLFRTYLQDYDIINIRKKDLNNNISNIKKLISENFIGLEIMQSSNDKIIIKDFLNMNDLSVYDLIRRMDRILMSIFEDARVVLEGDLSKKDFVISRDDEINRIYNLLLKVLKIALNDSDRKILKLDIKDVFYYWDLVVYIEEIGDQLKRMIRNVDFKVDTQIIELYDLVYENYKLAMKANFTKDSEQAIELMNLRKNFSDKCESYAKNIDFNSGLIVEKIKIMNINAGNIARAYVKLGS